MVAAKTDREESSGNSVNGSIEPKDSLVFTKIDWYPGIGFKREPPLLKKS
jgi:hypothetical protein